MRKLTLENQNELQPFIAKADYNEYNSNIVTMLMWSTSYEVYFDTFENYAISYIRMPHHPTVWMMPYCEACYRKEAVEKIREISQQEDIPFEIHSLTLEFKNWLQEAYPDQFLVWDCYDARDYIYDRKQQASLAGKKMQKRRNHYHSFEKEFEGRYVYKPLEQADILNIYAFLNEWKSQKEEDESIDAESYGIHFLLDHLSELPIQGGCIYLDGRLEAFNITSMLSKDTVEIHVEKANKTKRGLYIAILKLFLETLPEDVLYVNREDDMGYAELRKAKSDMHPIHKTQKFGSCFQPLYMKKATPSDLPQIKNLWQASFQEETQESTAYFFDHLYHEEDCYLLMSEDELISMLQIRKMNIMLLERMEQVSFVFGVATNKEYEGCGYMKRLLNHVLDSLKEYENFVLLQAYNWELYKSFGFQETYQLAKTKLDRSYYTSPRGEFQKPKDCSELVSLYKDYTADKNGYRVRDIAYYEDFLVPYKTLWGQHIYQHTIEDKTDGYIILQDDEDTIMVVECVYRNEQALFAMLSLLCQQEKKIFVSCDLETPLIGRRKEATCMMVKTLHDIPFPKEHLFINEEL